MFKKIVVSTCFFMAISCLSLHYGTNAQTPTPTVKGSISGTIIDKKSRNPIKDAKVSLKNKELHFKDKTATNNDGKYSFSDLSAGNYTLKVKNQGFVNGKKKIELAEGDNAVVDIQLKKETSDGGGEGGYVCEYVGTCKGSYSGDDYGTWKASIDNNCKLSGSAYSDLYDESITGTGDVSSKGGFAMVAGSANDGTVFSGQIYDSGRISGTWRNAYWKESGTFEGTWSSSN